jgi:arylsulfate sulfotransferase
MTLSLSPSALPPAPLGAPINWTATVSGANPGTLVYRFRVGHNGQHFRTLVDYGPKSSLTWTTIDEAGAFQMEASVKNMSTGDQASATVPFLLTPITDGPAPAVNPSANPLVYIYTAPACREGRVHVQFQSAGGIPQTTPSKPCLPGRGISFYLAGMLPNVPCTAQSIFEKGSDIVTGPATSFTPPPSTVIVPTPSLLTKGAVPATSGVLLQSLIDRSSIATDLNGNIVWSAPSDVWYLTRPVQGGTFMGIHEDNTTVPNQQFFREFDLAGITIAETNAVQVNQQLATLGVHAINGFHHEARKLPDGKYLVLADSERILTNVQGSGAVDVIGDTILVFNENLEVVWWWDSFDHLDTSRQAPLKETCTQPNAGCSPWYLAATANDWTHGNALQLTPDGNILYSTRNQDWVIKINYQNGTGDGTVLWHLGNGGDFQINSSDPSPWFSHQHDANFAADNVSFTVFDDGNTRQATNPSAHSRGQLLHIDESGRVATLTLNADVGSYSSAVGSAQALPNGDYHFDSGFIVDSQGNLSAQSVEVNAAGNIVYGIGFASLEYRTFRMTDLYTAP